MPLTTSHTRKFTRRASWAAATLAAGAAALALAGTAGAGVSAPEPSYGSAIIDGKANEWVHSGPKSHIFAPLYKEADPKATREGNLYAKYNCVTNELFLHVRAHKGNHIYTEVDPEDHFVRMGSNGPALVDGSDALSKDFAFIDSNADGVDDGWEARAVVAIGTYDELQVVVRIRKDADLKSDDYRKVYNGAPKKWHIPIDLTCKPDDSTDDKGGSPPGGGGSTPPVVPPSTPPSTPTGTPSTPSTPSTPVAPRPPATPRTPTTTRKPRRPNTRLVSKKRGPSKIRSGRKAKYTLRVTNRGKNVARKVVVRDVLPQGMVLVRRPKGAQLRGRTVIWRIKRIGAKRTVKRVLQVRLLRNAKGRTCNRMVTTAANAQLTRSKRCTRVTQVANNRPFIPAVTG